MSTQTESSQIDEGRRGLSPRAVIRRLSDGKVLLLRRPQESKHFPGLWEFPGGKPDLNENFAETLRREVLEETGLEVVPGAVVGYAEFLGTYLDVKNRQYPCFNLRRLECDLVVSCIAKRTPEDR